MIPLLIVSITMCLFLVIAINGVIVVGTINEKTVSEKKKLSDLGYTIFHADDLRNKGADYVKAGKIAFMDFLLNIFKFKKSALFTSNPKLLFLKSFIVEDLRVTRSENLEWVRDLPYQMILIHLPAYFSKDADSHECEQAAKRANVYMEELENYPAGRFKSEIKGFINGKLGSGF